jgi:hypothetical protein
MVKKFIAKKEIPGPFGPGISAFLVASIPASGQTLPC